MKNQSYNTSIEVPLPPKAVFAHINDVPKWWIKEVAGASTEFEGKSSNLNDEFILRHGDNHYSKHKLIEVIPNKKIVWLVTESTLHWLQKDKHEWKNTKMIFEIARKGDKTILHFTHQGLFPEKAPGE